MFKWQISGIMSDNILESVNCVNYTHFIELFYSLKTEI